MIGSSPFLAAAVRTATPLALAALGELITERSGVINISLEGSIIAGAFGAFAATSTFGLAGGYLVGTAAGALIGLVFALFTVVWRADQIVSGTAMTMGSLGLTGTLYRGSLGGGSALPSISTSVPHAVPGLSLIPWLGPALFRQTWVTYLAFSLVPEGMSAGRGFIAIAVVALGRWHPLGVFIAALVFGAAMAVQFVVQASGWHVRYELVLMLPYLLTLAALAFSGRGTAPAWLGRPGPDFN